MNPHEAILDELLQKVMVTLSRSDSGRDVAALVIRAADLSRELDEIRGGSKSTDAVSARLDEIGQLRSKKTKGA
ncbi:MAG: hypothetical protein L0K07_11220 [Yaniella sp.]|nr:hypothetical protein [Yaniella sp.]MDN6637503.1 hypothetical protein [Yaniella sp.]